MPVDVLEKWESIKIKLSQIIRMKVKLSFQAFSFWASQHKLMTSCSHLRRLLKLEHIVPL